MISIIRNQIMIKRMLNIRGKLFLFFVPGLLFLCHMFHATAQKTGNQKANQTAYFTGENLEAVQAISYGFKPWYERENELPGGVILIEPTGDISGQSDLDNIQNAVNRMSAKGGGKVKLAAGKFFVNNQIMMKDNVILRGAGMDYTAVRSVRTKGTGASWNIVMLGLHHPGFLTRDRGDVYHKVKFNKVEAGTNTFTIADGFYDDLVFTRQDNREYWDKHKPRVGDLMLIGDLKHGRIGLSSPKVAAHFWPQFVRITGIDGYTVTIDEPHVMGKESGIACWVPSPAPFNERANLPYWWVENCIVGDMEFENVEAMIMAHVGARNVLLENIKVIETRGIKKGIQINGFYKSTMRGCYLECAGGRSVEMKHGSARSLVKNNKFVHTGSLSWRPSISTGEGDYAMHFHDNEWHYKVSPDPETPMFFMVMQYGGSFKRNFIHTDQGAGFPEDATVFAIRGSENVAFTYQDTTHYYSRPTGFMVWEENRYEIAIGSAYEFTSNVTTDKHWGKGALISGDDWTGTVFYEPAAGKIINGYPTRVEDVVKAHNVRNLKGTKMSWLSEDPASSFPRLIADVHDPDELTSVITQADLKKNELINREQVRKDSMVVKVKDQLYMWHEAEKHWKNLGEGEDIVPVVE